MILQAVVARSPEIMCGKSTHNQECSLSGHKAGEDSDSLFVVEVVELSVCNARA